MPIFKRPHFSRLLALAQKGRIAPLYLFLGDQALARDLSQKLCHTLSALGGLVEEYDLTETDISKIRLSLAAPALLGRKVILAQGPAETLPPEESAALCPVLSAAKGTHSLILLVPELPEQHPLVGFAQKEAVLVPLKKSYKAQDFLQIELPEILADLGKKMDRSTAELLLELVGEDPSALRQELEKLSLYVGERAVISKEDVVEVVSPRPEQAPYQLLDTLLYQGPEEALRLLRQLVEQGTPYLVFVSILANFFKRLWLFQYLLSQSEILRQTRDYPSFKKNLGKALKELWPENPPASLKVHPYVLYRLRKAASLIPQARIIHVLRRLAEMDLTLKSQSVSAEDLFYVLFLEIKGLLPAAKEPLNA